MLCSRAQCHSRSRGAGGKGVEVDGGWGGGGAVLVRQSLSRASSLTGAADVSSLQGDRRD